jgi:hypothetical protein
MKAPSEYSRCPYTDGYQKLRIPGLVFKTNELPAVLGIRILFAGSGSGFFSEVGSGQNGPDPPTLITGMY